MVQIIGFMIAAYIITRMTELLTNKQTHDGVALLAFATIAVAAISVLMLFTKGGEFASILRGLPP